MAGLSARLWKTNRLAALAVVVAAVSVGWMGLVASHNPGGFFGESAAAWAQAIMSVGAILAAIVIDQGASRRDRQDRLEAAARARAARIKIMASCASVLDNAAKAAASRQLKRGRKFDGLAAEAVKSMRPTLRHFVERGSDDDPILVWALNRTATEMEGAEKELIGRPLATQADLLSLQRAANARAQGIRELIDEYQAGLY